METPASEEGKRRSGRCGFAVFLAFFFLYLMADTFLESDPYGETVTYLSLAVALLWFFRTALSRQGRTARG